MVIERCSDMKWPHVWGRPTYSERQRSSIIFVSGCEVQSMAIAIRARVRGFPSCQDNIGTKQRHFSRFSGTIVGVGKGINPDEWAVGTNVVVCVISSIPLVSEISFEDETI